MASCHTHATLCQSSHRIHRIHRSFWCRIFSHRIHRIHRSFWRRIFSHGIHGIHGMLGCVIGSVGMAGMPYPPNLCTSVQSVGGFLCQKVLCVLRVLWEHSLCLLCWCCRGSCTSVVVFSHGIHGIHRMLGCVIGSVGMAGMPYPPNLLSMLKSKCFDHYF